MFMRDVSFLPYCVIDRSARDMLPMVFSFSLSNQLTNFCKTKDKKNIIYKNMVTLPVKKTIVT